MALLNSVQGADARTLPPLSPSNFTEAVMSSVSSLTSLVPPAYVAKVDDEEEDTRFVWCLAVMLIFATFIFIILVSRMRRICARSKMQVHSWSRKEFVESWKVANSHRCAWVI